MVNRILFVPVVFVLIQIGFWFTLIPVAFTSVVHVAESSESDDVSNNTSNLAIGFA